MREGRGWWEEGGTRISMDATADFFFFSFQRQPRHAREDPMEDIPCIHHLVNDRARYGLLLFHRNLVSTSSSLDLPSFPQGPGFLPLSLVKTSRLLSLFPLLPSATSLSKKPLPSSTELLRSKGSKTREPMLPWMESTARRSTRRTRPLRS